MREAALRVEDGHVEPLVVGLEPRGPDDRSDLAAAEVEPEPRRLRDLRRGKALGSADLGVLPCGVSPLVERVQQPLHLQIGQRADVAQAAGEQCAAVTDGRQAAHEVDAHRRQRVQVERRSLGRADQLGRREPPRPLEILDLVVALIPHAGGIHPPEDVAAAIRSRQPDVLSYRENHRASRLPQLGRQLHARGRGADDEHATVGELGRVAVVERSELLDVGR